MDDSHKLHIDHEYCVVFRLSVIGALMNTVLLLFVYKVLTKPLPSKNVLIQSKHIIVGHTKPLTTILRGHHTMVQSILLTIL